MLDQSPPGAFIVSPLVALPTLSLGLFAAAPLLPFPLLSIVQNDQRNKKLSS